MTKPKSQAETFADFGKSLNGALDDIARVDEVQNMLLIRLAHSNIAILGKLGMTEEAVKLVETYQMAAEVLKAGADLARERIATYNREREEEE